MPRKAYRSKFQFDDLRQLFDKAIESERGIDIRQKSSPAAMAFRHRLNSFRVNDRNDNAQIYPVGDPLHGASVYDAIVIRVVEVPGHPDGNWVCRMEKRTADNYSIEEIKPDDRL